MCNCISEVDAKLAPRNTRLSLALCLYPINESLMIETEIIEKKRGAKAVSVFPRFCPFCGEKIPDPRAAEAETAAGCV